MTALYDLHSHSTASDGTLSPTELVQHAKQAGVTHLALTDHDTLDGVGEAAQAAQAAGITLIGGAELSVSWRGQTIHIVGLQLNPACRELQDGIARQLEFRDWRGREIARRLEKKAGVKDAYEGALGFCKGRLLSRTHFARYLHAAGYAPDHQRAIKRYLLNGRPGHVAGEWATLEAVLGWIHAAGGLAVIAHPARYAMTATKLRKLLSEFRELGGQGIEVVSGSHTKDDMNTVTGHALRFELLASAGSDYHGPENPWIELGRLPAIPPACTAVWASPHWHEKIAA